jgi:hypothetical protein
LRLGGVDATRGGVGLGGLRRDLIGAFFLLFGALRMGWVAAFIPTPVFRGFIEGLVCVTIIGKVPHLLGIDAPSGLFFTKFWSVLQHLPESCSRSADRLTQPVSHAIVASPGASHARGPGRCGRGHHSRPAGRRSGRRCKRGR